MTSFPFSPTGNTANLTADTTTGNVQVTTAWPKGGGVIRATNKSTDTTAFVAFGTSAVEAATATSMPILPSTVELFTVGELQTYAAGIVAAGSAALAFTPGQGGV